MSVLAQYRIGESIGGDQDWFEDDWMKRGGCGAITACECCIFLARERGMRALYPFDAQNITREDFLAFGMRMKPYLPPRMMGINKTSLLMDGFREYLSDCADDYGLKMTSIEGTEPFSVAEQAVRAQIEAGFPVPYLMLRHTDDALYDFIWHWFIVDGIEDRDGKPFVRTLTFGKAIWLDFPHLWDTGNEEKGGFILLSTEKPE